jgi:hypothetical protein
MSSSKAGTSASSKSKSKSKSKPGSELESPKPVFARIFILLESNRLPTDDERNRITALNLHIRKLKPKDTLMTIKPCDDDDDGFTILYDKSAVNPDDYTDMAVAFVYVCDSMVQNGSWKTSKNMPPFSTYILSNKNPDTTTPISPLDFWRYVTFRFILDHGTTAKVDDNSVNSFVLQLHKVPTKYDHKTDNRLLSIIVHTITDMTDAWECSAQLRTDIDTMQTYASQVPASNIDIIARLSLPFSTNAIAAKANLFVEKADRPLKTNDGSPKTGDGSLNVVISAAGHSTASLLPIVKSSYKDLINQAEDGATIIFSIIQNRSMSTELGTELIGAMHKRIKALRSAGKSCTAFFIVVIKRAEMRASFDDQKRSVNSIALSSFVTTARSEFQMMFTLVDTIEYESEPFWENIFITVSNRANMQSYIEKFGTKSAADFDKALTNASNVMKKVKLTRDHLINVIGNGGDDGAH